MRYSPGQAVDNEPEDEVNERSEGDPTGSNTGGNESEYDGVVGE